MAANPISRAEAIQLGSNRYFTGKPCLRGHVAPRIIDNGTCETCHYERTAKRDREHPRDRRKEWRAYYLAHPELRTKSNAYFKTRRGRAINIANVANAVAKRSGVAGRLNGLDVIALWDANDSCFYCRTPLSDADKTIDHYMPMSRGGANTPDNLRCSCMLCNQKKKDKLPADFHGVPAIGSPGVMPE
jgi:5-methylcytosine-specific restriction endonuclease McrA